MKIKPIIIIVCLFVLSTWFWFAIFEFSNTRTGEQNGTKKDTLSGAEVNYDAANSAESPNPNLPYFAGVEQLSQYGISNDDRRYIMDVLINYTLYSLHKDKATISFVKDSFKVKPVSGTDNVYSFNFGVNGSNIHTIDVVSNFINSTIKIVISKDGNQLFKREFVVYQN